VECEVNHIRGFIPASQVSLYRIEDLSTLVGEKFACVVTEAKPEKRNLVLSRRAFLEREKAEAKEKLLAELAPGQVREGTVRSVRDFGAFVDLGGVDGLVHVSQIGWTRVKHPNEVLHEGQPVKVKIQKIDPTTGKISLSIRDIVESPWTHAAQKYPAKTKVTGRVTKIMEFGAFVELEPGVEGLVHVSELAHQRVWRTADVVSEGQEVEAQVVSIDADKQRIALSMKAVQARPEPKKTEPEVEEPEPVKTPSKKRTVPLKGGRASKSGGEQFGLNW
jgi:small subunit ribosomal protein S1